MGSGGKGIAYLLDGTTNNSLFTLELTNATIPPEGIVRRIFAGGTSEISLGELTVDGSDVYWQAEIGYNGLMDGVNCFEARLRRNGGVWWKCRSHHRTSLPTTAYRFTLHPKRWGSIRALQSAIQRYNEFAQEGVDLAANGDLQSFKPEAKCSLTAFTALQMIETMMAVSVIDSDSAHYGRPQRHIDRRNSWSSWS